MKLSTVMPLETGSMIIRDLRGWVSWCHSQFFLSVQNVTRVRASRTAWGTNLSEQVRAMPNVEFHAPWFWHAERMQRTMPHENCSS